MSLFQQLYAEILQDKQDFKTGKLKYIPLPFDRFGELFPGIQKGKNIIVTANSGVGKTKFIKFLVTNVIPNFIKNNKKLSCKIVYFAMEDNYRKFWKSIIAMYLYIEFEIEISETDLNSVGGELDDDVAEAIGKLNDVMEYLEEIIDVVDYINNPFGIYKYLRAYATMHGTFYDEDGNELPVDDVGNIGFKDEDGKIISHWTEYVPDDPYNFMFVVLDNLDHLIPEKNMTKGNPIREWTEKYAASLLCRKMGFTIFNLQQQVSSKEEKQFTVTGKNINEKLEPSLDGLGNSKESQRDMDLVLGIFAPNRYDIKDHRGYNIGILKNNYRQIRILKDRDFGRDGLRLHCFFDGACNYFAELPKPKDLSDDEYEQIKQWRIK